MKRFFTLILGIAIVFSFVGCSQKPESSNNMALENSFVGFLKGISDGKGIVIVNENDPVWKETPVVIVTLDTKDDSYTPQKGDEIIVYYNEIQSGPPAVADTVSIELKCRSTTYVTVERISGYVEEISDGKAIVRVNKNDANNKDISLSEFTVCLDAGSSFHYTPELGDEIEVYYEPDKVSDPSLIDHVHDIVLKTPANK